MEWRRLDVRGSDHCELVRTPEGWQVAGVAEYDDPRGMARLEYSVDADTAWCTVKGSVRGAVGGEPIRLEIVRTVDGRWALNGVPMPDLIGLVDLDLGFTPATNLFPLRRLALRPGESADAAAAWLDEEHWILARLSQRYERRDTDAWWYESPEANYAGLLRVNAEGFVTEYPGLWSQRLGGRE
ncbi:MAG TPA: putative glycolipid-binding domain-containing protein [Gemmatimonadales bacterium]|nr:putative glycolipid-binding domain-containing protein [Gemmatimonadales bacterium]